MIALHIKNLQVTYISGKAMAYLLLLTLVSGVFLNAPVRAAELHESEILMGDMIVPRSAVLDSGMIPSGAGDFVYYRAQPWPGGVLPVVFTNRVTPGQRSMFFSVCAEWSKVGPIRCVERGNQRLYLLVDANKASGCHSTVGAVARARMNMPGCFNHYQLIHEIGHAFGLIHEHQRADRDQYISVNLKNVKSAYKYAYSKLATAKGFTPYDFLSVMHYPADAYASKPNKLVMVPKAQFAEFKNVMGKYRTLSDGDIETIRAMYR